MVYVITLRNIIPIENFNILFLNLLQSPSLVESGSIKKRHVRVTRATDDQKAAVAAVGTAPDPAEDISNVESDDADRNKRFLPFGGEGGAGGGSGNFLFDLIRVRY